MLFFQCGHLGQISKILTYLRQQSDDGCEYCVVSQLDIMRIMHYHIVKTPITFR